VAQPAFSQVVQFTNVQLNPTANRIEIILETPEVEQLQVLTRSEGDVLIADIPNTKLAIPEGGIFLSDDLPENIAGVTVTQFSANSIRVTAIGKAGVPKIEMVLIEPPRFLKPFQNWIA
jgi:iron complex outermembrane receptor protein